MSTTGKTALPRLRYSLNAYRFLFTALRYTQEKLGKTQAHGPDDEQAHISGPELLFGIRDYARENFGLLAKTVFNSWGIHATDDFGAMVFELIERGEMRKTDRDQLIDFYDVYDFDEAFSRNYRIDVSAAFSRPKRAEKVKIV